MSSMDSVPYTERVNGLTVQLDTSSAEQMVELLGLADAELFPDLLNSAELLQRLDRLRLAVREALAGDGLVVMSGCGTSGRIALATAAAKNARRGGAARFVGLLAGGVSAMLVPQELGEDDPAAGARDLQRALADSTATGRAVFVGITCGLSAAYVAGQLDWALDHPELVAAVVLVGFNPVQLARDVPVEGWTKTFRQVACRLADAAASGEQCALIVNPIVGAEAVQGSSRMKGGSMTKILLDVAIDGALDSDASDVAARLQHHRSAVHDLYAAQPVRAALGAVVELAGSALRARGHVYYLATSASSGWLALIDASECLCTYGAALTDVRCFLPGGWRLLGSEPLAADMAGHAAANDIFNVDVDQLPWHQLTADDALLLVVDAASDPAVVDAVAARCLLAQQRTHCRHAAIAIVDSDAAAARYSASLTGAVVFAAPEPHTAGLLLKLCLNAVTTGGHVIKGKVFHNRMIDLAVSNNKLFNRTVGIIEELAAVSRHRARHCLLQAIHQSDTSDRYLPQLADDVPISQHIAAAVKSTQVVPIALLLALQIAQSAPHARSILADQPIVNKHITAAQKL